MQLLQALHAGEASISVGSFADQTPLGGDGRLCTSPAGVTVKGNASCSGPAVVSCSVVTFLRRRHLIEPPGGVMRALLAPQSTASPARLRFWSRTLPVLIATSVHSRSPAAQADDTNIVFVTQRATRDLY